MIKSNQKGREYLVCDLCRFYNKPDVPSRSINPNGARHFCTECWREAHKPLDVYAKLVALQEAVQFLSEQVNRLLADKTANAVGFSRADSSAGATGNLCQFPGDV